MSDEEVAIGRGMSQQRTVAVSGRNVGEGTWLAVEVPDGYPGQPERRFGLAVVARRSPDDEVFVYLFGPWNTLPSVSDIRNLRPGAELETAIIHDDALRDGTLPVVWVDSSFSRADWPMPEFSLHSGGANLATAVRTSDDEPFKPIGRRSISPDEAAALHPLKVATSETLFACLASPDAPQFRKSTRFEPTVESIRLPSVEDGRRRVREVKPLLSDASDETRGGVYAIYDRGVGFIVHVGIAENVPDRISWLQSEGHKFADMTRYRGAWLLSSDDIVKAEAAALAAIKGAVDSPNNRAAIVPTMGTWDTGIFDDDVAMDARDAWEQQIASGSTPEQATRTLIEELSDYLEDGNSTSTVWLALAALQLEAGALQRNVADMALRMIPVDLASWRERGASEEDLTERERILADLAQQLR